MSGHTGSPGRSAAAVDALRQLLQLATHTNLESQSRPIHDRFQQSASGERRHHIHARGVILVDQFAEELEIDELAPEAKAVGRRLYGRRLVLLRNGGLLEQERVGRQDRNGGINWNADALAAGYSRLISPEEALSRWAPADIAQGVLGILRAAENHHRRALAALEDAQSRAHAIAQTLATSTSTTSTQP